MAPFTKPSVVRFCQGNSPGPDGSWLIVAAAGGGARNPAWYYNLAAHPDKAKIEIGGHTIAVTAEQLHGTERSQAWQQITAATPRFAQYQGKTDRELPVIRLVPRPGRALEGAPVVCHHDRYDRSRSVRT